MATIPNVNVIWLRTSAEPRSGRSCCDSVHDELQRSADAAEINLHGAGISLEDPASLSAELGSHLRSKSGLFVEEPEILFVEEAKHWAIPLRGKVVKPVGGHRESAGRQSRATDEEPKEDGECETTQG